MSTLIYEGQILSEWKPDEGHGYNWVRYENKTQSFIGLNCADGILYDLYNKIVTESDLRWRIFGRGFLQKCVDQYIKIYGYQLYRYGELDEVKNNIDKVLISFPKLKVFI